MTPVTPTKIQRWLDLLSVLLERRYPVPSGELYRAVPAYREDQEALDALAYSDDPEAGHEAERIRARLRRRFERDKEELRRLGIPLETTVAGGEEGYRIPSDRFYLPLLDVTGTERDSGAVGSGGAMEAGMRAGSSTSGGARAASAPRGGRTLSLSVREASAALEALRHVLRLPAFPLAAEARTALRKLTFDLDPAAEPDLPVRVLERPGGADPAECLPELVDALLERKRVGFAYRPPGTSEPGAAREVEPWGLFFQWGGWYLVGHDPSRRPGTRVYRVDRMEGARRNAQRPGTPDFERPPDFSVARWMHRRAWELAPPEAEPTEVQVHFLPPLDRVAIRNGWGMEAARGRDATTREAGALGGGARPAETGVVRVFTVFREDPFLRWILSHAGEARILAPAPVVERFNGLARAAAAAHGGEVGLPASPRGAEPPPPRIPRSDAAGAPLPPHEGPRP